MSAHLKTDNKGKAMNPPVHSHRQQRKLGVLLLGLVLALGSVSVAHSATLTRTSSFAYDAASGLITKEIIEPDNSNLCVVTEYVYDAYGNKTGATIRNCNGSTGEAAAPTGDAVIQSRTTSATYDARGQFPLTATNALSQSETKTFDPKTGVPLSLVGPNGLTTTWQYDGFGRKTRETRADGTQTKWDYLYCNGINGGTTNCPTIGGAVGTWLVQETPLASDGVTQSGPLSKTYYDALSRPIRTETQGFDGSGASTAIYQDTQYDSLGRPYMKSRPYYAGQSTYWVTVTYDSLGRVIQENQADSTTTTTAYNGLTVTVTNAKSQTRSTLKNSQGQIVRVTDAQNQNLTYTYDPFGNLLTTTDPLGNVVTLTYDLRGRKTQMQDPDMGTWAYAYNALGQLVRQIDAKAQVSTLTYDKLGRMTNRSEADLISNWYYDTYKGGAACNKGIGKLCQSETSTGYNKTLAYDNLGRQISSATTIDVPTPYAAAVTYDANGRVATQSYPTGLVVKYVYTTLGYLKEIRDNGSNALYWQANSLDAEGHLLQQTYGNTVQTAQSYNPANGRITAIQAGTGNSVQNLSYQYDNLGNVTTRGDTNQSLTETFIYDSLNRLTSGTVNSSGAGIVTQTFAYNGLGNITSKSDLGNYTYPASGAGSARPHAVSQVTLSAGGNITFAYDANGSLTTQTQTDASNNTVAGKSRAQFYTSFNMPQSMGQGTTSAAFYYGPEHQRVKQISSVQGTTVYVNPGNEGALFYEKDVKPDGSIEQRAFITAGGQAVAIVKAITSGGTTTTAVRYLHRDNLGSVTAVTNEAGSVIERLAYEPFGKRRFANGTADPNGTILPQNTDRGYTGHEMIDEIGLIHMNGRVYDPLVGRFLSADPYVQAAGSLQSYNRYSYISNNPLNGTDPSGYFSLSKAFKAVVNLSINPFRIQNHYAVIHTSPGASQVETFMAENSWARVVGHVAAAYFLGPEGAAFTSGYETYAFGGSNSSIYKSIATSYLTAVAFEVVGDYTTGDTSLFESGTSSQVANIAGHAMVGCASASASGGSCASGAFSAGAGAAWSNFGRSYNSFAANITVQIVIGGTASEIGGGKFSNGAITAAFGYLFNYCAHDGRCFTTASERAYLGRGDYAGYYKAACAGGDSYACQAGDIAGGKTLPAMVTTARLTVFAADAGVVMTPEALNEIRLSLARGYADYLGNSADTAKVPSAMAIAKLHWDVFGNYGIPPRAFGGTPLGSMTPGGTWYTKQYPAFIGGGTGWCPSCAP